MTNTHHITGFALAILLFLGITSCEKIEEPYEKREDEDQLTAGCDSLSIPSDHPVTRNVLIEDFTGHTCGNCPGAALEAENIQGQYAKGKVLIAGVHSGYFAEPKQGGPDDKYTTDFRTQSGETYNTHYSVDNQGLPQGLINRKVWNGDRVLSPSEWSGVVDSLVGDSVDVTLQMAVDHDEVGGKVCVDVATRFLTSVQDTLATTVYLLEDSVIDWQKNYSNGGDPSYPSGDVENYEHSHVLRAVINGTWGETVLEGTASSSDEKILSYGYELKDKWDPEQMSVVAYVYDKGNEEILQAIKKELP